MSQNAENQKNQNQQKIDNKAEDKSICSKTICSDNVSISKPSYKHSYTFNFDNSIHTVTIEIYDNKLKIKVELKKLSENIIKSFSRDFTLNELQKINKIFKTFDKIEDAFELFENLFTDKKELPIMKDYDQHFQIQIKIDITKDFFILDIPKIEFNLTFEMEDDKRKMSTSSLLLKTNELKTAMEENEDLKKRIYTLEENQNKIIEFFKEYDKEKENRIKSLENQLTKIKQKVYQIFSDMKLKIDLFGQSETKIDNKLNIENKKEINNEEEFFEKENNIKDIKENNNCNSLINQGKNKSLKDLLEIINTKNNISENLDNKKSFFKNIYKNIKINSTNELKINEEDNVYNLLNNNNNIKKNAEEQNEINDEIDDGNNYLYSNSEDEIIDDIEFFNSQNKKLNNEEFKTPIYIDNIKENNNDIHKNEKSAFSINNNLINNNNLNNINKINNINNINNIYGLKNNIFDISQKNNEQNFLQKKRKEIWSIDNTYNMIVYPPNYEEKKKENNKSYYNNNSNNNSNNFLIGKIDLSSEILEKYDDYEFIHEYLKNKLNLDVRDSIKLFSSSEHGDSAEKFHSICDNNTNIIVVIKTKDGCIFGGFSSIGFDSSNNSKIDESAFIFSVNEQKIFSAKKGKKTIDCFKNLGPSFHEEAIYIMDNFLKNGGNTCKKDLVFNTTIDYEINNGKKKFYIDELEVIELIIHNYDI